MLLSKQYATRGPMRLALLTMLVLLVFAWHFYLERVAYYDLAYDLFTYLRTKQTFIAPMRFVSIATQYPTLVALRAGWPLDQLMRLYSVTSTLCYLAVFLACAYWLRNEHVALVLVLLFVLLASRTFYSAQSELPQSLAALLLFYAGIARQAPVRLRLSTLALAALVPVFIFGHPLCILPFLFMWAYDWLLNRRFRDWGYYGLLALALGLYQLRFKLMTPGSYEDTQMTFTPNLLQYFPHYLSLESFRTFWHLCRTDFIALPVLLAVLSVFYLRQRTWLAGLRLALVGSFVAGYVFIVNVSKPGYTEATYLENIFLPLTLFVAIPFAMELLPALERRWQGRGPALATGLLLVLLGARLVLVWYRHESYTAYQRWLAHLTTYTRQFPERKFLLWPDNVDPHRLRAGWPWWAMASETMMVSARQHPDSVQTVRVDWKVDELAVAGARPGVLLGPFEQLTTAELPANYFRFPATTSYRLLNTEPPHDTAALRSYIAARRQVGLALVDAPPTTLRAARWSTLRVQLNVPPGVQPLHSGIRGPHPTVLRTAFYKPHDWPSDTNPLEAALEVDVWQPWTQTLPLKAPQEPGRYTLEVSLLSKDYRDWPVRLRLPVDVVK